MPFWRRNEPVHKRLGRALMNAQGGGFLAHPPLLDGTQVGEPAIHGVARPRRWDAVATADAPGLPGEQVTFVALPDGSLVVDEDVPDGTLAPLADAAERTVVPPYRAEAVRREGDVWAVAARRIDVVALPTDVRGDAIELVLNDDERTLTVDGERAFGGIAELERAASARGYADFVARAERIDGELWEVELTPL